MNHKKMALLVWLILGSFFVFGCSGGNNGGNNGNFMPSIFSNGGDSSPNDNLGPGPSTFCSLSPGETPEGFAQGIGEIPDGDGSEEFPHLICTAEQLANIQNHTKDLNLYFKLQVDLDLSSSNWIPIGTGADPFAGHFNGGGYTLRGLNLPFANGSRVGLFGETSPNSIIENINVYATITVPSGAMGFGGGVVGDLQGVVRNSTANVVLICGQPLPGISFSGRFGAIAGRVHGIANGSITDSQGTVTISSGTCDYAGGVAGIIGLGGSIIRSTGSLTTNSDGDAGWNIGGLVGEAWTRTTISQSFGSLTLDHCEHNCGGLVGFVTGTGEIPALIEKSHALTYVINAEDAVGGLVGTVTNGIIRESYSVGILESVALYTGGLVGLLVHPSNHPPDQPPPVVEDSYAGMMVTCSFGACGGAFGAIINGEVSRVFSLGPVRSSPGTDVGPFMGTFVGGTPEFVYYNQEANDPDLFSYLNDMGVGLNFDQLRDPLSFPSFDFFGFPPIWALPQGADHPQLFWQ